jgi:hypothetical protein
MACVLRQDAANVINWTNNSAAIATKGALLHLGNGLFGVAVDSIAISAVGPVIIDGYFEGVEAVVTSTATIGATLKNSATTVEIPSKLSANIMTSAGSTWPASNLRLMTAITAATTASRTFAILLSK